MEICSRLRVIFSLLGHAQLLRVKTGAPCEQRVGTRDACVVRVAYPRVAGRSEVNMKRSTEDFNKARTFSAQSFSCEQVTISSSKVRAGTSP